MTQVELNGMKARAEGKKVSDNPYGGTFEYNIWNRGFFTMDGHIQSILGNASDMIDGIREAKNQRFGVRDGRAAVG